MSKPTAALIGAGSRGKDVYGSYVLNHPNKMAFTAVVEPKKENRDIFTSQHDIEADMVFDNEDDFFALGKVADAVIIAHQDQQHYETVMKALDLGYDILLEKPMSPSPEECLKMEERAKEVGAMVMVCHVLRYTPFFMKIKEIIENGDVGHIINVNHTENIGSFHYAHSFARGNWRNAEASSPIILAKSCHDMDILNWLVDSRCSKVASFGDKRFFTEENAPEGSGDKCSECGIASSCDYNSVRNYRRNLGQWPTLMIDPTGTEEALDKALQETSYGDCVWKVADHDVCDHQLVLLEFENGVKATFTLTAFSNKVFREIRIHGTKGVIEANDRDNHIRVTNFNRYDQQGYAVTEYHPEQLDGGHNGGDTGLMNEFCKVLADRSGEIRTSLSQSMESHMMCFAAEEGRIMNKIIAMEGYKEQTIDKC